MKYAVIELVAFGVRKPRGEIKLKESPKVNQEIKLNNRTYKINGWESVVGEKRRLYVQGV